MLTGRGLAESAGIEVCDRRVEVQRLRHRASANRCARGAEGGRESPATTSASSRCPARSRFRSRRRKRPRADDVAAVICLGCLIRGATAALRVHRVGVRARHHRRGGGDRRADDVRRADDQLGRGSARASGRRIRPTRDGRRQSQRSRWRRCSARSASRRPASGVNV